MAAYRALSKIKTVSAATVELRTEDSERLGKDIVITFQML